MRRACTVCGRACDGGSRCPRHPRLPATRDHASHKRFARAVLRRDGRCVRCGARAGLVAHHLVPHSAGGSDDPANGVALCAGCHRLVDRYAR